MRTQVSPRTAAPWLLLALYGALLAAGLARHSMWRDEIQAWLIARDTSLAALPGVLHYEGHPALFYLLLMPLARLTQDPAAMQALNFLVMAATMALLLLRGPFTALERALMPFGYHFLYEYGLKSRSYSLGTLILVVICTQWRARRERPIRIAVLLALLANTHMLFLLVALALALLRAVELLRDRVRPDRRLAASAGLLAAGLVLAILTMVPPPDSGFAQGWTLGPSLPHAWDALLALSGLFGAQRGEAVLALAAAILLAVTLGRVRRSPLAALFLLAATGSLAAFFYAKLPGFTWHHGLFFVVYLATCWLDRACYAGRPGLIPPPLLAIPLSFQLLFGVVAYVQDLRTPLSEGSAVAALLQQRGWAAAPIAGLPDTSAETVAGYLPHGRIYYGNGARWGSFVVWDQRRLQPVDLDRFLADAAALGPSVTLIVPQPLDPALLARHGFVRAAALRDARDPEEKYVIYRRDSAPPSS